jgi:hypothetical protein
MLPNQSTHQCNGRLPHHRSSNHRMSSNVPRNSIVHQLLIASSTTVWKTSVFTSHHQHHHQPHLSQPFLSFIIIVQLDIISNGSVMGNNGNHLAVSNTPGINIHLLYNVPIDDLVRCTSFLDVTLIHSYV